MTLTFRNGNMFDEPGEAIVNTVNCVGVMGKGVALEFKKRWPANFAAYRSMCQAGHLRPGRVFIHANAEMLDTNGRRFLINFPTKDHWRAKSRMEFISAGLDDLVAQIVELRINKVVMPPLGCGNGGLDWSEVRDVIMQKLGKVADVEFVVYAPSASGESHDRVDTTRPTSGMTFERALLIRALDELAPYFDGQLTRIVMQKIAYFLQEIGVPFGVEFSRNEFGPYSDDMRKAFMTLERQGIIEGFTSDERESRVTQDGARLAREFLSKAEETRARLMIDRLDKLFEGYESPFGLEVLSSVHFIASNERVRDVDDIVRALGEWSERKSAEFDPATIRQAHLRLQTDQLLS